MIKLIKKIFGITEKDDRLTCPNCGFTRWVEGPSGGISINVQCYDCKSWFNYDLENLDPIKK